MCLVNIPTNILAVPHSFPFSFATVNTRKGQQSFCIGIELLHVDGGERRETLHSFIGTK
jgi:hypothetical protein